MTHSRSWPISTENDQSLQPFGRYCMILRCKNETFQNIFSGILQPKHRSFQESGRCSPLEGAACGSVAGCIAAGLTTPLDVAKTRIMLTKTGPTLGILSTLKEVIIFVPLPSNPSSFQVYTSGGIKGLYSGVVPRVMWISGGGFVFFGAYETAMHFTKFLD